MGPLGPGKPDFHADLATPLISIPTWIRSDTRLNNGGVPRCDPSPPPPCPPPPPSPITLEPRHGGVGSLSAASYRRACRKKAARACAREVSCHAVERRGSQHDYIQRPHERLREGHAVRTGHGAVRGHGSAKRNARQSPPPVDCLDFPPSNLENPPGERVSRTTPLLVHAKKASSQKWP